MKDWNSINIRLRILQVRFKEAPNPSRFLTPHPANSRHGGGSGGGSVCVLCVPEMLGAMINCHCDTVREKHADYWAHDPLCTVPVLSHGSGFHITHIFL